MTETQFLIKLAQTTKSYSWYLDGNKIRAKARNGKDRGQIFDPITAVARFAGYGTYSVNQRGRKAAGEANGTSATLTGNLIDATEAKSNRGIDQVLRGRIKQTLNL